jgi:hypothetical protein
MAVVVSEGTGTLEWAEETPLEKPNVEAGSYGWGTAISGDGLVLAVSDNYYEHNPLRNGRVYLYDRVSDAWVIRNTYADIVGDAEDGDPFYDFGRNLSLSADGSVLAVGAPGEPLTPATYSGGYVEGCVYIYEWGGASWSLRDKILETDLTTVDNGGYMEFGNALALSDDGSMLVVGCSEFSTPAESSAGGIWTYIWNTSVYAGSGSRLALSNESAYGLFGWSVAINSAGTVLTTFAIRWSGDFDFYILTYDRSGSTWVKRSEDTFIPSIANWPAIRANTAGTRLAVSGKNLGLIEFYDWVGATGWVKDTSSVIEEPIGASRWGETVTASRDLSLVSTGDYNQDKAWTHFSYLSVGESCFTKVADQGVVGYKCIEAIPPPTPPPTSPTPVPQPPPIDGGSTRPSASLSCSQLLATLNTAKSIGASAEYIAYLQDAYWGYLNDGSCS